MILKTFNKNVFKECKNLIKLKTKLKLNYVFVSLEKLKIRTEILLDLIAF